MSSHPHRRTPLALIAVLCSVLGALVVGAGSAGAATPAHASVARPIADAPAVGSPAPAVPAVPATTAGTPCATTAVACVDLSSRQAWLTDGAGHVTYGPVGALGGTRKYPTPTGTFSVDYKDADHVSNLYDAAMPNSVFFAPAVAFHRGSLSQRSHGCIHLGRAAAQRFFNELSSDDTVQVVP